MRSKWNLLYAAIATALLLSACGTDTEKENPTNTTNGSPNAVEEPNNETNEEKDPTDIDTSEPIDETDVPDSADDYMEKAQITSSDAQDYTIALLPNFKLTSEEPGRDSLYVDGDDAYFMRIETMIKEDGAYDYAVENTVATLEASSGGNTPSELTDKAFIPVGEDIEDAIVFSVQSESGPVTGIVFERDDMLVKLTIFDSPKEAYFESFLRMSETIVNQ